MACRPTLPAKVWKLLYAMSGNQCAFDGCEVSLVGLRSEDEVVLQGDMAHIIAASQDGPRGDSKWSDEQRARPANILLLCVPCHRLVDDYPEKYPAELLRDMKQRHEERVQSRLGMKLTRTLPRKTPGFTGRDAELAEAITRLSALGPQTDVAPLAVLFTGAPGIGKTALAVQLATAVAANYPDGQVFLRRSNGPDDSTSDLVDDLLVLLTGGQGDAGSRSQRLLALREILTRRRILIVIDDIRTEADVLDLLEVGGDFGIVVTSRSRLSGLADTGLLTIQVGRLSKEAGSKVACSVASRLTETEAADLTQACGGHPLAIRIAASRLASRPALNVSAYIGRLATEDGLSHLAAGQRTVAKVIEDSYRSLPDEQAALIRVLGQLPAVGLSTDVIAAALIGVSEGLAEPTVARAELLLDALFEQQLVEQPLEGVYQLHDYADVRVMPTFPWMLCSVGVRTRWLSA